MDDNFEELLEHDPSWMVLERATACRKRLLAAGYLPLPVNGKEPSIAGWQDIAATNKIINTWVSNYADATNTGILTYMTPTIDIDIMHPDAAAAIEALAREHFEERGRILVRFGKAPKRAILLRSDVRFKKVVRKFIAPDGSAQQIEIMANGQQIVVFGIHKETQRPYSWHGGEPGEVKHEDLPSVSEADMRAFLDAANELLIRDFGFKADAPKRKANGGDQPRSGPSNGAAGSRERAYATAALDGCAAELAAAASGGRNDLLNKLAFRLGRMIASGWIDRAIVEAALTEAMQANGYADDDGIDAVEATLKSGLDSGQQEPHPDLADRDGTPAVAAPQHPGCSLAEVHAVFRKWFSAEYDLDTIDAVMATAAAERLAGDPLWLLVISGPGNTKTETVSSLSGAGAHITSTIASEGALLSATPRKSRIKDATGGLLRKIGDRGVLVIKDVTSILSANRDTRAGVLAALREVYDGLWERNVGSDGGQTLTWRGRLAVVGAVTTAWDAAHGVVSVMGDRFVLIRPDSGVGRRITNGESILPNIDGRSALARRYRDIAGAILVDQGGADQCSESRQQLIRRFAAAAVLAEQLESRLANGEAIDIQEHATLSSTLVRLSSRIGIDRRMKDITPTLSEYLSNQDAVDADTD